MAGPTGARFRALWPLSGAAREPSGEGRPGAPGDASGKGEAGASPPYVRWAGPARFPRAGEHIPDRLREKLAQARGGEPRRG